MQVRIHDNDGLERLYAELVEEENEMIGRVQYFTNAVKTVKCKSVIHETMSDVRITLANGSSLSFKRHNCIALF